MSVSRRTWMCGLSISAFAPDLLVALQHAPPPSGPSPFNAEAARQIEALAEAILPGSREAHVVDFIQRAVGTVFKDQRDTYVKGLAGFKGEPEAFLRSIENTPFFETLRTHTIMGYLVNPSWGGNKDQVGWKAIGFKDEHSFQPPFGYYDDPKNAG